MASAVAYTPHKRVWLLRCIQGVTFSRRNPENVVAAITAVVDVTTDTYLYVSSRFNIGTAKRRGTCSRFSEIPSEGDNILRSTSVELALMVFIDKIQKPSAISPRGDKILGALKTWTKGEALEECRGGYSFSGY